VEATVRLSKEQSQDALLGLGKKRICQASRSTSSRRDSLYTHSGHITTHFGHIQVRIIGWTTISPRSRQSARLRAKRVSPEGLRPERGGELNGQWQSVQAQTDFRD